MNVTSWKAKNSKPGIARIHKPWDAVVTVKTPASGSVMSAIRRRCSPSVLRTRWLYRNCEHVHHHERLQTTNRDRPTRERSVLPRIGRMSEHSRGKGRMIVWRAKGGRLRAGGVLVLTEGDDDDAPQRVIVTP